MVLVNDNNTNHNIWIRIKIKLIDMFTLRQSSQYLIIFTFES